MKNLYHSTRDKNICLSDDEAILQGIADDGGLFVLDSIRDHPLCITDLIHDDYMTMAGKVMKQLLPSFDESILDECIQRAYGHTFGDLDITPLRKVEDDYILELFHGPTSAFKDVGLQMLPQLMSEALKKYKDKVMILTATSGDTGKAALEGFKNIPNIGISIFYPERGVSEMQRLQMVTQLGDNVMVCALKGNFDDAQSQVKNIFSKRDLAEKFKQQHVRFSSANSINIGRLIPQVVYYFYAYMQMVKKKEIEIGTEINFCVPTGNFGNVLAGYYAKLLGLPVHRFIVASNANNVLYDFLQKGVYDRNRSFLKTISPSMDILISSNLERLLYYMGDYNCQHVAAYMKDLKEKGSYTITKELKERIQNVFYGGYSSDFDTKCTIRHMYERTGYVMDPHTAVGYKVMKEYQQQDQRPCVLLSTASPFKFADEVYEAIFGEKLNLSEFEIMSKLATKTMLTIPKNLSDLKNLEVRFSDCIQVAEMESYVTLKTKEILK